MPRTDVVFYQEAEGDVPVLDWLKNCVGRINRRMRSASPLWSALRNWGMSLGGLSPIF